jgi:hypothetical protein
MVCFFTRFYYNLCFRLDKLFQFCIKLAELDSSQIVLVFFTIIRKLTQLFCFRQQTTELHWITLNGDIKIYTQSLFCLSFVYKLVYINF